jgi:hypothetical protein
VHRVADRDRKTSAWLTFRFSQFSCFFLNMTVQI